MRRKSVGGAVIITAGLREIGDAGATREAEVKAIAERHGIRLFGPNCLGITNTEPAVSLNATFRLAPLTDVDARDMVRAVLGRPILTGARGAEQSCLDAIEWAPTALGALSQDLRR